MDDVLKQAVEIVRNHHRDQPRIGMVLGSGLGSLVDELDQPVRLAFDAIPGFPVSTVSGHHGEVVWGRLSNISVMALSGRAHYYEGYPIGKVVFPLRVMAALGLKTVIITNAAGAINTSFRTGDIVAIKDHINLMGIDPLQGLPGVIAGPARYSRSLLETARRTAEALGIRLLSGVYVGYSGPSYETPAEIRAFKTLGGDLVGMSAVPEVIAAHGLGMRILALSLVTNMAAGVDGKRLSHRSVIAESARALPEFKLLVKAIVQKIAI